MHLFFDTVWKLHIGEIPEKPMPIEAWETKGGLQIHVGGDFGYSKAIEKYNAKIAAIKQNALTIANPEIIPVFPKPHIKGIIIPKNFKPGEFYKWYGGYETKEIDTIEDGGGCYVAGSQTVAILTLPEEKKNTMENSAHGFTEGSEFSGSVAAPKEEDNEKEKSKLTKEADHWIKWLSNRIALGPHHKELVRFALGELQSHNVSLSQQLEGMKSILKEIEFQVYAEGWSPQERLAEIKKKFPKH